MSITQPQTSVSPASGRRPLPRVRHLAREAIVLMAFSAGGLHRARRLPAARSRPWAAGADR